MVKTDPLESINPFDPFIGIYVLVTHKSERGTVHRPDQVLTRQEALRVYTINNAYKSGEEDIKGSIEPGKLADFVVLEKDFLSCSDQELKTMKVLQTVVGGKTVFSSQP